VYTSLDYPGTASTEAVGINNSGIISGWYVTTDDVPQGFTYSEGTFTSFTYPRSSRTNAKGVNNHGEVAGFYGTTYSFVDSDGAFTSFGYPGAEVTYAYGINDTGQIAGYYQTGSGSPIAFFYDGQSTFTSIEYPGATETFAYGINNSNVVVGQSANSGTLLGFLWQNGQFTVVGPPDSSPLPFGINNNGQIVGIYFPGGVAQPPHSALPSLPVPATNLASAAKSLRYDAAYVVLAEELGAALVTRDSRLASSPGHSATIELF
jgi:probable HAF family extracellular repeat protein